MTLLEKCDIIRFILNKVNKLSDLIPKLHEIFHEDKKATRLMTIHRAKGLECERVFFIERYNDTILCPSKYATKDWEIIQEKNLLFVAYTRAKSEFCFINYQDN